MIGTVLKTVGGAEHKLRLSIGAMKRLEAANGGQAISEYLEGLQKGQSVTGLCKFLEIVMNDGKGASEEEAEVFVDQMGGLVPAMELFSSVIEAAFPDAAMAAEKGKPAPAGKKKPAPKA